ncbi:Uncharacterised protein [Mycobacterium tuberculosis]|nr:Uncharacterised protein [Mycobacterium tuberculosis]
MLSLIPSRSVRRLQIPRTHTSTFTPAALAR